MINQCPKCKSLNVTLNIVTNKIDCKSCKIKEQKNKVPFEELVDEYKDGVNRRKNGKQ